MALPGGSTLTPLGFFIPPTRRGPPSPLLADNIDPETGDFRSLFTGSDVTDAQVQLAVTTVRSSGPSVLQDGLLITSRKITDQLEITINADMRQALRRLTRNRDIRIVDITQGQDGDGNQPGNQTAQTNVRYKNLRALDPTVRTLQVPATPQIVNA